MSKKIDFMGEPKPKKSGGQPKYNRAEVMDYVCEQIATSTISIRVILREAPMKAPSQSGFMYWLLQDEVLADQYARAKELQSDHMAEELLDIVDDGRNDFMEIEDKQGGTRIKADGEHIQRSRLRADTRRWLMGKMRPKKYGDRVQQDVSGELNGNFTVKIDYE